MSTKLAEEDEIASTLKDHMKNLQTETDSLQEQNKQTTTTKKQKSKKQLEIPIITEIR